MQFVFSDTIFFHPSIRFHRLFLWSQIVSVMLLTCNTFLILSLLSWYWS